jgi:hypothetical protein
MEEGSLLQEALNNENSLENALIVDVYLVDHPSQKLKKHNKEASSSSSASSVDNLLALAETAVKLNEFLQTPQPVSTPQQQKQSQDNNYPYPWLQGGDGPVFGVHVTDRIPHLRAVCQYGVSVADEWMLIHKMLQFSALQDLHLNDPRNHANPTGTSKQAPAELAIECWDVDDGQVLLIESADVLPDWVDRIGPINCRHRCWIRAGRVQLIAPMETEEVATATDQSHMSTSLSLEQSLAALVSLSLEQALAALQQNDPARVSAPARVNQAIQATCQRVADKSVLWYHTTALAVPRSVAWLVHSRPDLVAAACQAFAEHAANSSNPKDQQQHQQQQQHQTHRNNDAAEVLAGTCQDWVWTTARLGRTHYSMLRTVMAAPDWNTEHAIPPRYRSIEVKRLQRQCAVQATPHLRYALQLGVRLVAGLDYLILSQHQHQQQQQQQQPVPSPAMSSLTERRVLSYWSRIASECQSAQDGPNGEQWLRQAWQAGPNQATYDIASVLKCPVFEEEVKDYALPLSRPGEELSIVVKKELLKTIHPERDFVLPRPQDVDDEKWMAMPSDEEMGQASVSAQSPIPPRDETLPSSSAPPSSTAAPEENPLDKVLGGFQSFMTGQSGVDGISSHTASKRRPIEINPTVFLNILHTVLQAKSPEDISFAPVVEEQDPFFSQEDYDCMEPEDDDDDDDDDKDNDLVNLMAAMDQELQSAATSRGVDRTHVPEGVKDENIIQDAHVLSNLLESMEAGAGGPGPMQNIMKEMGLVPPTLPSEDEE